ncbi:MAG: right-handed parallel beta-helix repeat-containing protein [Proteobacteria bacterium]|nr:right-handed parallel beta-helix repeat-containing protein [Pseudomonadota bacterium]MBU1716495.1 right-handed parallel beta-helix repeat-containing protein [Pseudomonadota bacterium]
MKKQKIKAELSRSSAQTKLMPLWYNTGTLISCWLILGSAVFLLSGCSKQNKVLELEKQELKADTIWSGQVLIKGDIYVPPGVTLTVAPGTVIRFKRIDETSDQNMFDVDSPYYPQAEIIIRGRLIAKGTAEKKIVFTSAEMDARAADWGALNFLGSDGNVVEHTKILCAYNGIHAHGSEVKVTHNEFVKNGVGISFKAEEETQGVPWFGRRSKLVISDNLITGNKGGIGFRNSDAEISHNEITNNKFFGVWPKENVNVLVTKNEISGNKKGVYLYQAKGVKFEYNNIYDNSDYNVAAAEAQDFPLDFSNNWFGSINRQKIDELIFDHADDPDLAVIKYEPFLTKSVDWESK